jgi:hypothetical protein
MRDKTELQTKKIVMKTTTATVSIQTRFRAYPALVIWASDYEEYKLITDQQCLELAKSHKKYNDCIAIILKAKYSAMSRMVRERTEEGKQ